MSARSATEYAYVHARVRARIGSMPDETDWQRILNAGDLEATIESMATSGLSHWVKDFPRSPGPEEIERRCLIGLLGRCFFVKRYLPDRWLEAGRCLLQLPHVLQMRTMLSTKVDEGMLLPGSPFSSLLSLGQAQRLAAIRESEYSVYLDDESPPESCWIKRLDSVLPRLNGHEREVITHVSKFLFSHQQLLASSIPPDQVWAQRQVLFGRLKGLLAGDPFHAGTVLIYGLLESIQFERVRAILLLRAYQWPTALLRGLS